MNMRPFKIVALLLVLLPALVWADGDKEYTKVYKEEYTVALGALLEVKNKYGNVDITTGTGDQIIIEAEVIVEARSESKAQDILDRITIDISGSRSKVSAITEYESKKKAWNWNNNENYKVHYTIQAPADIDINLSNKYGDVAVDNIKGDMDLYLKYGNGIMGDVGGDMEGYLGYVKSFSIESVGEDFDLDIAYSNLDVGTISGDTDIESKYSEIEIESAQHMDILSKYDEYEIGTATTIDNDGKYDDFRIGEVNVIDTDTKYTKIRIRYLGKVGEFDTGYGSVDIDELADDFQSIEISSGYTGYEIGGGGAFSLTLESKYTSTSLPDGMEYSLRDRDSKRLNLKGYYDTKNSGSINAVMKYGSLKIK